jgi:predicted ester cyclase
MGATEDRNKAIIQRVYDDGYNGGDEALYAELYHPTFHHHSKTIHDVGQGGDAERQSMLRFRASMPDARFEIVQLLAEGDMVAARLHITGTPGQDFGNVLAADGPFDRQTLALFRLEDGLLMEEWFFIDGGTPAPT